MIRTNLKNTFNRSHGGFSIVELLLVMGAGVLFIFLLSSFGGNIDVLKNLVGQKLQSRSDIEQVLQIMTTEIRSAGPSSLGAYAIESASTSSFIFYSDIYKNGLFDRVRYFFSTSTIQKGVVKPAGNPLVYSTSTEIITTAVENAVLASSSQPVFNYYDSFYTGTQAPLPSPIDITKIRLIQISLYADVSTGTAPKAEFFTAMVGIRNLKSN